MTMSSCAGTHAMAMRQPLSFDGVHNFLDTLFGDDLHAKRVKSLAGATLGAIQSASLAVGLIGQGLALARGRLTKHAVKQVDRLLSNRGIDVDALLVHWVPYVVGQRDSITVAMDWTEFDADGQATIMLSLLSRHGRATPLVWLTVDKAALKNRRNGYELSGPGAPGRNPARRGPCSGRSRLRRPQALPGAERGSRSSTSHPLSRQHPRSLPPMARRAQPPIGLAPAVARDPARCRGHRPGVSGRHRGLRAGERHEKSRGALRQHRHEPARALIKLYAKRWEIEGAFPRHKGSPLRHGARIDACQHAGPAGPLWLINAFAVVLLTLWAPPENNWATIGTQDQHLQTAHSFVVSSGQHALRTHAKHDRFSPVLPLIKRFTQMLAAQPLFAHMFGAI